MHSWFALHFLPVQIFIYILAGAGLYLAVESIREILNSNKIGMISFVVGAVVLLIGLLPLLNGYGIGPAWFAFPWLSTMVYQILFIIEGLFLFIAMFAMEL